MSLDEALFGRLHGWLRRKLRPPDPARAARRVELEPLQKRLGIVASLLAGRPIEVRPTGDQGSRCGDRLLLPAAIDWAPSTADNLDAYLLRTALAVAAPDATDAADADAGALDDDARALATLRAAPSVVAQARRRWPGFGSLFDRLAALRQQQAALRQQQVALRQQQVPAPADVAHRALAALERVQLGADPIATAADLPLLARPWLLQAVREAHGDFDACLHEWRRLPRRRAAAFDLSFWGDLLPSRATPSQPTPSPAPAALPPTALPTGTERAAPAPRRTEVVELPPPEGDSPLQHVFEKVKTAEEHQGGNRQLDGSDELQQHLDAIQQLDLRRLVRSRVPTASIYHADLWLDGGPVDVTDDGGTAPSFSYDEWDDGARAYRRGWCSLYVDRPPAVPAAAAATALRSVRSRHARTIRRLRAELERLERRRALQRRQLHGTDVDVDAVIDRHAALRASARHGGCVDDQRLYTASRPTHHDLATLLLLDQSLSTDSWVDNRRVLDVARDSVAVLGEVLRDARMRTAVAAFSSNARRDCRFQVVKGFDDPWRSAHARLFGLRPTGYTRIGPAIRHAAHLLTGSGCRRRVLLIVSDGKPTDYDRYEGRYGIADVRQAVREARQRGITTIALAIDRRAKDHLPRMFGEHGYRLLRHPRDLPQALARLHEHLLR